MSPRYRLHYAPDNASAIVRLALEELGLRHETALVDRQRQAQRSAAFLKLNPAGRIPVLETPEGPIFETGAILLWLADRHGGRHGALAPAPDAPTRGAFLAALFFLANTVHSDLSVCFHAHRHGPAETEAAIRGAAQARVAGHIGLLERMSGRLPGWFCGPAPSVLDVYAAFLLRWARLYPIGAAMTFELAETPRLAAMLTRLERRETLHRVAVAEGLGPHPFTAPALPAPPEGSAL